VVIPPGLRPPPPVEFDFGRIPLDPGREIDIAFEVVAEDGRSLRDQVGFRKILDHGDITVINARSLRECGLKARASADETKLLVYGWVDKDGKVVRRAVRGEVWARGLSPDQMPTVKNPPPPPVRFDLSAVPLAPGRAVAVACQVVPADRGPGEPVRVELTWEKADKRADLATALAAKFVKAGLLADAAGEVVQVRGWPGKDGAVRPAARGPVFSLTLKKGELPKVTGAPAPAPCVEFDFAPLAAAAGRAAKVAWEVGPGEGGKPLGARHALDPVPAPAEFAKEVEFQLVGAGFKAERDGAKVRVFGWADEKMRLTPTTAGTVTSADLKKGELPTVTTPPKP
jgi:hypothetical protein